MHFIRNLFLLSLFVSLSGCSGLLDDPSLAWVRPYLKSMGFRVEPRDDLEDKPRNCCWCKSPPGNLNSLFPTTSAEDCALKMTKGNYYDCKYVLIEEGECDLVKMRFSSFSTKYQCEARTLHFKEGDQLFAIEPPKENSNDCETSIPKPSTSPSQSPSPPQ